MSLDARNRRQTVLVLALVGVVLGVQTMLCRAFVDWVPLLTMASLLPTLGVCWALAPIGLAIDARAVSLQRGGSTGDAWVISDQPVAPTTLLPTPDRIGIIRATGALPSRAAANLFWLARYVERAEYLARILEVTQRLTTLPLAYVGSSNEWESAVATAGCAHAFAAAYPEASEEAVTTR